MGKEKGKGKGHRKETGMTRGSGTLENCPNQSGQHGC